MITVTALLGRVTCTWRRTGWDESHESLTLTGYAFTSRPAAVRAALMAMAGNPDEPVVPIVDPSGPTGMYRIDSVTAEPGPAWVLVTITATPVRRPALPAVEVALTRSVRVNSHAITTAYHNLGVPGPAVEMSWLPGVTATQETRVCGTGPAAGTVLHRRIDTAVGRSEAQYRVDPTDWWEGGCHVTVDHGGQDVPHVGRGSLPPGAWTAGNGLVELEVTAGGFLSLRWSTAAGGWTTASTFMIDAYTAITSAAVVHLSANEVKIALTPFRSAMDGRVTVMARIRRGSAMVDFSIEAHQATIYAHRVTPQPTEAVTNNTSYVRRASVPGGGADWVIAFPDSATITTGTGVVAEATALQGAWQWGIGARQASGPTNLASAANVARSWFSTGGDTVLVGVDP